MESEGSDLVSFLCFEGLSSGTANFSLLFLGSIFRAASSSHLSSSGSPLAGSLWEQPSLSQSILLMWVKSPGSGEGQDACLRASWDRPAGWALYILLVGTLQRGLWRDLLCSGPVGLLLCTSLSEVELNGSPFFSPALSGEELAEGLVPVSGLICQSSSHGKHAWHSLINQMLYSLQMAKVPKGIHSGSTL